MPQLSRIDLDLLQLVHAEAPEGRLFLWADFVQKNNGNLAASLQGFQQLQGLGLVKRLTKTTVQTTRAGRRLLRSLAGIENPVSQRDQNSRLRTTKPPRFPK